MKFHLLEDNGREGRNGSSSSSGWRSEVATQLQTIAFFKISHSLKLMIFILRSDYDLIIILLCSEFRPQSTEQSRRIGCLQTCRRVCFPICTFQSRNLHLLHQDPQMKNSITQEIILEWADSFMNIFFNKLSRKIISSYMDRHHHIT